MKFVDDDDDDKHNHTQHKVNKRMKKQHVSHTDNTESLAVAAGVSRECFRVPAWHVGEDNRIDGDRGTSASTASHFVRCLIDLHNVLPFLKTKFENFSKTTFAIFKDCRTNTKVHHKYDLNKHKKIGNKKSSRQCIFYSVQESVIRSRPISGFRELTYEIQNGG